MSLPRSAGDARGAADDDEGDLFLFGSTPPRKAPRHIVVRTNDAEPNDDDFLVMDGEDGGHYDSVPLLAPRFGSLQSADAHAEVASRRRTRITSSSSRQQRLVAKRGAAAADGEQGGWCWRCCWRTKTRRRLCVACGVLGLLLVAILAYVAVVGLRLYSMKEITFVADVVMDATGGTVSNPVLGLSIAASIDNPCSLAVELLSGTLTVTVEGAPGPFATVDLPAITLTGGAQDMAIDTNVTITDFGEVRPVLDGAINHHAVVLNVEATVTVATASLLSIPITQTLTKTVTVGNSTDDNSHSFNMTGLNIHDREDFVVFDAAAALNSSLSFSNATLHVALPPLALNVSYGDVGVVLGNITFPAIVLGMDGEEAFSMAGIFSGGREESELTALIIGHATRGEAYNLTIEAIPRGPDDDSLVAALMAGVAVHVPVKARDTSDTPTNVTMIVLDLDGPDPSSAFINIQLELSPPMLMTGHLPSLQLDVSLSIDDEAYFRSITIKLDPMEVGATPDGSVFLNATGVVTAWNVYDIRPIAVLTLNATILEGAISIEQAPNYAPYGEYEAVFAHARFSPHGSALSRVLQSIEKDYVYLNNTGDLGTQVWVDVHFPDGSPSVKADLTVDTGYSFPITILSPVLEITAYHEVMRSLIAAVTIPRSVVSDGNVEVVKVEFDGRVSSPGYLQQLLIHDIAIDGGTVPICAALETHPNANVVYHLFEGVRVCATLGGDPSTLVANEIRLVSVGTSIISIDADLLIPDAGISGITINIPSVEGATAWISQDFHNFEYLAVASSPGLALREGVSAPLNALLVPSPPAVAGLVNRLIANPNMTLAAAQVQVAAPRNLIEWVLHGLTVAIPSGGLSQSTLFRYITYRGTNGDGLPYATVDLTISNPIVAATVPDLYLSGYAASDNTGGAWELLAGATVSVPQILPGRNNYAIDVIAAPVNASHYADVIEVMMGDNPLVKVEGDAGDSVLQDIMSRISYVLALPITGDGSSALDFAAALDWTLVTASAAELSVASAITFDLPLDVVASVGTLTANAKAFNQVIASVTTPDPLTLVEGNNTIPFKATLFSNAGLSGLVNGYIAGDAIDLGMEAILAPEGFGTAFSLDYGVTLNGSASSSSSSSSSSSGGASEVVKCAEMADLDISYFSIVTNQCSYVVTINAYVQNPLPFDATLRSLDLDIYFDNPDGVGCVSHIGCVLDPKDDILLGHISGPTDADGKVTPVTIPSGATYTVAATLTSDASSGDGTCFRLASQYEYYGGFNATMKNGVFLGGVDDFAVSVEFNVPGYYMSKDSPSCLDELGTLPPAPFS